MGTIPQKVPSARFQGKLHWPLANAHLLDVTNSKTLAAAVLVSLCYRRSYSLHLHATMTPNLWTVLAQELRVTLVMKSLTFMLKPEDQVYQVKSFRCSLIVLINYLLGWIYNVLWISQNSQTFSGDVRILIVYYDNFDYF